MILTREPNGYTPLLIFRPLRYPISTFKLNIETKNVFFPYSLQLYMVPETPPTSSHCADADGILSDLYPIPDPTVK